MIRSALILSGLFLMASCHQNPENGGAEVRGNEQRSDTAMNMSGQPAPSQANSLDSTGAQNPTHNESSATSVNAGQHTGATANNGGSSHANNARDSSLTKGAGKQ